MRALTEKDLPLLNLILDRDPDLALIVDHKLAGLEAALAAPGGVRIVAQPQAPAGEPGVPSTAPSATGGELSLDERILDWFRMHPGKHKLSEVRGDLKVDPTSKPFKTSLRKLIAAKKVKSTGLKGRGAEYWLG